MKDGSNPNGEKESPAGSSDPGVAHFTDPMEKRPLFQRAADFLFGFDFFISYCWADGRYYATELHRKLAAQGFNCFLDSSDYAKGDNWRAAGRRALKKTSRLILVGTPRAVLSKPVANELRIFSGLNRRIFPIDFGGALSGIGTGEGIFQYLDPDMLRVNETETALTDGPSEDLLHQIRNSFNLLRQDQKRIRWLSGLAAVFALVAAVAVALFFDAQAQKMKAVAEKRNVQRALSKSDFLHASELLTQDSPREALAFLAHACRQDADNRAAATLLFFLLSQKEWVLPVTAPLPLGVTGERGAVPLERVRFSPDGSKVVATSWTPDSHVPPTGFAQVWDLSGRKLLLDQVPCNTVMKLADEHWPVPERPPRPDERCFQSSVVLVPAGNEVRICDLQQGRVRTTLHHPARVTAVQFGPKDDTVLIGDDDGVVTLWKLGADANTAKRFAVSGSHKGLEGAAVATFDRAGTLAVVKGNDAVEVWKLDLTGMSATPIASLPGSDFKALSEDGKHIVIGDSVESVGPDPIAAGDGTKSGKIEFGLEKDSTDNEAVFSDDGNRVARMIFEEEGVKFTDGSTMSRLQVGVCDLREEKGPEVLQKDGRQQFDFGLGESNEFFKPQSHVQFSPDGSVLASVMAEQCIQIWSADHGALMREALRERQPFTDVAFSPDGRMIATAAYSGCVQIWDIRPGLAAAPPITLAGVRVARLSEDGRFILPGKLNENGDRFIPLTDTAGTETLDARNGQAVSPAVAPLFLEPMRSKKDERLVNPITGKQFATNFPIPQNSMIRWSRDGRRVLIVAPPIDPGVLMARGDMTILDASNGSPLHEPIKCTDAWFDPAGDAVLLNLGNGGSETGAKIMDIATGKYLATLVVDLLHDAVWTSDGITILADSFDSTSPGLRLFHFDFPLASAPASLADIAEGFAQLKVNEAGITEAKTVVLPDLCQLLKKVEETQAPPAFVAWAKAFVAARGIDPRTAVLPQAPPAVQAQTLKR